MSEIQLPKLRIINPDRPKRKKILLLSDDLRSPSGIAAMSREFVLNSAMEFDWVQIGSLAQHPDHGKIFDESDGVNKILNIDDAYVKIYAHTGYGNAGVLRELIQVEKPDVILHFTDPRYWDWLYHMEHELRTVYKIPIAYYNIWDCPPAPMWNKPFYQSCDLIMNISKQTHNLVKMVLGKTSYLDIDTKYETEIDTSKVLISYVPHGINKQYFRPMNETDADWNDYQKFLEDFRNQNPDVEFIVFWNNRNAARKQPGDVVLSFKTFCDRLPKAKAKKCALLMHTDIQDPNGTDLIEVKENICPDYKIIFSTEKLPTTVLNYYYNIADVTLNIASNEGFGLSNAESLMAGTMVIANVTGGLQDQMRFEDENGKWIDFSETFTSNHAKTYTTHGRWVVPVYPSNRSLQGSLATPYIFDDRCYFMDVADAMLEVYNFTKSERNRRGLSGREWLLSNESNMEALTMTAGISRGINTLLKNWTPPKSFIFKKIQAEEKPLNIGIV